ncbi:response regulator transcription factor [Inhella sp. 1Y17]|uniref:Response regulator transcription factor n=1 Tax=Inhella proteolytica TaxID=2795029 RepID=A0A931J4T9_9BURK|nr:response regulator transcription factor [Inhella proteolytica]
MLSKPVALVDDDSTFTSLLAEYLRGEGLKVDTFHHSAELLAHPAAYEFGFYVLDLAMPGIDGLALLDVLRRRTQAGVVVVSGRLAPEVFGQVVHAGADMYLTKPVQFEQVAIAIRAVQRRVEAAGAHQPEWVLDRNAGQLITPDGQRVELSEIDCLLMEQLVAARGEVVSRDTLLQALGKGEAAGADGLNAVVYRLKRRIEKATPAVVPLQAKSRVGYQFRAPLRAR